MVYSNHNQFPGFVSATPGIINDPLSLRRRRVFLLKGDIWRDVREKSLKEFMFL